MKGKMFIYKILVLGILLFSGVSKINAPSPKLSINNNTSVYKTSNETEENQVSIQQLKAQIKYFKEALDKLGAASPEQAAEIWAQGPKTRNGVLQYAVACDNQKAAIIDKLGKPEENFWNIGVSSPWVERYDIGSMKKITDSEYQATIKYYWATSTGAADTTQETLSIIKKDGVWCVREVK